MMNPQRIKTALQGIASIVAILERETSDSPLFGAIVDRFADTLIMAGTELDAIYRSDPEATQEIARAKSVGVDTETDMEAVVIEDAS